MITETEIPEQVVEDKPGKPVTGQKFTDIFKSGIAKVADKPLPDADPAPEPPPNPDDLPPEVKSDAAKSNWKKLKESKEAAEKRAIEFEEQMKVIQAEKEAREKEFADLRSQYNPDEIAKIKAEREQLHSQLRLRDVQALPEFKRLYTDPIEGAIKTATSLVPEDKRRQAEWLLRQPESADRTAALESLAEGLSPLAAGRFGAVLDNLESKRSDMQSVLANEKDLVAGYEAKVKQDQEQLTARQIASRNKAIEAASRQLAESKIPVFTKIDGNDAHNKAVDESFQLAAKYATVSDPSQVAQLAHWAVVGQRIFPNLQEALQRAEKAESQIAKMTAAAPKPGATPSGGAAKGTPAATKKSFTEAMGIAPRR
jgi:hypothetical protein